MTRYTRGITKSTTHNSGKIGSSTPWEEFKKQKPSRAPPKHPAKHDPGPLPNSSNPDDIEKPEHNDNDSAITGTGNKPALVLKAPPQPSEPTASGRSGGAGTSSGGIKLVKLFGLYLMTQVDARRLQKLKTKLKNEGSTRKVITEALKDEIRKAETKLKRMKDKTCFGCRGFGHLLADCPNKKKLSTESNDSVAGTLSSTDLVAEEPEDGVEICFKCGSTEHTSRNCVKNRNNENFKFATCFICQKVGHITKQCPENKNGVYPTGGQCKECGSITHLIKDCPKIMTNNDLIDNNKSINNLSEEPTCDIILDPKSSIEYEPVHKQPKKRMHNNNNITPSHSNDRNRTQFQYQNQRFAPGTQQPANAGKKRRVKF